MNDKIIYEVEIELWLHPKDKCFFKWLSI